MLNIIFTSLVFLLISLSHIPSASAAHTLPLPSDALALLTFKASADPHNHLRFYPRRISHCNWQGVKCVKDKVVRFVLEGVRLGGTLPTNSLSQLDQLRVLSLQNDSLTGPIPDLSSLVNLKSLFLDHNSFTGSFPPSILDLHRLRVLDLSFNDLSGPIPTELIRLDRVYSLSLQWNRFNGSVPPLNQTSLTVFNVSKNHLTGAVPVTEVLSRFDVSAFSSNPGLCGEIVHEECHSKVPFFRSSPMAPPPSMVEENQSQSQQLQGNLLPPPTMAAVKHKKYHLVIGLSIVVFLVIGSFLFALLVMKKKKRKQKDTTPLAMASDTGGSAAAAAAVMRIEEENELEVKVKKMQLAKSGTLVFCAGEAQVYSLDQLMRASAEMLGRGSIGTTYKAVLDNQLILSVKRLDALKTAKTSRDTFERHLGFVGSLRHPNLVSLRAYFQAKEERLIIYDYQPNGSLFSLIHGSKSTRAKPLHWTSCLKIAEDVAQGLAYIHQASRLVHGNLKSSNILIGAEFEACLTDYCLAVFSDSSHDETDSAGYWAPETRRSSTRVTAKSDVYSFGILLMELLTGKPPSQHPFLAPADLSSWVRSVREVETGEENRLAMLLEVAITCSLVSPEQRPTMWQVLKMIQEIKETIIMEDNEYMSSMGFS